MGRCEAVGASGGGRARGAALPPPGRGSPVAFCAARGAARGAPGLGKKPSPCRDTAVPSAWQQRGEGGVPQRPQRPVRGRSRPTRVLPRCLPPPRQRARRSVAGPERARRQTRAAGDPLPLKAVSALPRQLFLVYGLLSDRHSPLARKGLTV